MDIAWEISEWQFIVDNVMTNVLTEVSYHSHVHGNNIAPSIYIIYVETLDW